MIMRPNKKEAVVFISHELNINWSYQ